MNSDDVYNNNTFIIISLDVVCKFVSLRGHVGIYYYISEIVEVRFYIIIHTTWPTME